MTDSSALHEVKESLDKYVLDNVYTAASIPVHYEGLPFDDKSVTEWVAPRMLDVTNTFIRQGSNTEYSEDCNILFQFNIFVKKSKLTVSHRHYQIRDILNSYFKVGKSITLYQSGVTAIDYLKVRRIVNDSSLPETNELLQSIFAVELDFTKKTTNPT